MGPLDLSMDSRSCWQISAAGTEEHCARRMVSDATAASGGVSSRARRVWVALSGALWGWEEGESAPPAKETGFLPLAPETS